ncbi:RNFT2 isoform 5 [Pan troglodytes]|uniref:Ring finger protein, transmembrane 2 n=3 Tax=Hominidae TaxID=9604 RepID=F8VZS7_HUMAN|nr:RNFT2 isoform 5 [Pan troglodytes]PNJ82516.1 RNFT2 isoform 6 [Pongo abelii]
MWLFTVNQVLRKMQRRHSSNTDNIPPESCDQGWPLWGTGGH